MKRLFYLYLIFLAGCFLVFSHESKSPSIVTVHLLPPKLSQALKPDKPIDAHIGIFPFDFDLKFSEEKQPFYFDYSHLPTEFFQNVAVLLESGVFKKVVEVDKIEKEPVTKTFIDKISEKKLDVGLFIKVRDFNLGKKRDGWFGSIRYSVLIISQDGNILKEEEKTFSIDKLNYPDNVTIDYQSAMATSELFNLVYDDLLKTFKSLASNIESHRSLREIVRGKGIITIRRADVPKGKAKVLVSIRVRAIINDFDKNLFASKEDISKRVNRLVEDINKNNLYKLILTIKEQSETFYPFKLGKIVYDSNNDTYNLNYAITKEFVVTPGKALIVANLFLPKVAETVTKGVYVDVNPEKGASVGLNILVDTKNNFFDIGFIK